MNLQIKDIVEYWPLEEFKEFVGKLKCIAGDDKSIKFIFENIINMNFKIPPHDCEQIRSTIILYRLIYKDKFTQNEHNYSDLLIKDLEKYCFITDMVIHEFT